VVNEKLKTLTEQVKEETQLEKTDKAMILIGWLNKILDASEKQVMDKSELESIVDNKKYLEGEIALLSE
jgi:hypothetical protein